MTPFRLLLLLTLAAPVTASAQTSRAGVAEPATSALRHPGVPKPLQPNWVSDPSDSLARIRATYWKEGAVIGGVAGGVGLGLLAAGLCSQSETSDKNCTGATLLGALLGAVVGGVPGALIGGSFPKGPRKTEQDAAE
jgi:hypothetical protein